MIHMNGQDIIVVMLSVSGNTSEMIRKANDYKAAGCKLVSITASDDNVIAKMSDFNLSYYINDIRIGESSKTTQIPALGIIEILSNMSLKLCNRTLQ